MKKLAALLLVIVLVSFSGCSIQNALSSESSSSAIPTAEPEVTLEPTAEPTPAPTSTNAPTGEFKGEVPTGEGMLKAYEAYNDFVSFWYRGGNAAAIADAENLSDYKGQQYCRYEYKDIKTLSDLKETALQVMSEELFDSLQKSVEYIDKDGGLYGPVVYGNGDDTAFAGNESDYTKISDTEYELKVATYYYASAFDQTADAEKKVLAYETTCKYSLVNSRWIFTSVDVKNTVQG